MYPEIKYKSCLSCHTPFSLTYNCGDLVFCTFQDKVMKIYVDANFFHKNKLFCILNIHTMKHQDSSFTNKNVMKAYIAFGLTPQIMAENSQQSILGFFLSHQLTQNIF